jgi:exopolysaccharide production protein ExoQ
VPPQLALALTIGLIAYLLRRDFRQEPRPSMTIWIPILWLMIIGSRQVSQWLGGEAGTIGVATRVLHDGNPLDKAVYGALILAGLLVLLRRRTRVKQALHNGVVIVFLVFLLYAGLSVLWSDFPVVAFKRWVKALGDPVMVLVLLTDPFPARAITATISRCAFVLIPLSVLFSKYYEHLGRSFDSWGNSSYTGVATDKNMLAYLLFAFGLFFVATLVSNLRQPIDPQKRLLPGDVVISVVILVMIAWLLVIANSSTAMVALAVGVSMVLALRVSAIRRHIGLLGFGMVILGAVGHTLFSLTDTVAEATARDSTFTGRTGLWEAVLAEPINPLLGVGYASFWLGERLWRFWALYPYSPPIQAHNGYLETYLNLGLVGVCLLALLLGAALNRARHRMALLSDGSASRSERIVALFSLAYCVSYLLYNITEATFQGMNFLFVIFLILSCSSVSTAAKHPSAPTATNSGPERARLTEKTVMSSARNFRGGQRHVHTRGVQRRVQWR